MKPETIAIIISGCFLVLCMFGAFARVEHRLTKLETMMAVICDYFKGLPKRTGD
ncbi:hypothetical protein ES702_07353 [subsurface metagenome]